MSPSNWVMYPIAIVLTIWAIFLFVFSLGAELYAHEAMPTAAQPLGWKYPSSCCSGYDCRRVGDAAPIPQSEGGDGVFITETTNGFVVNTTHELIAHGDKRIKDSPDGMYHWCSTSGSVTGRTICLYVPPRAF